MRRDGLLTALILLGLVGGAAFGQYVLFNPAEPLADGHGTRQAGELILIRPLMLLVIPLVFVSVVVGVTSIGNPSRLGLAAGTTLLFFLVSMLLAATLGVTLATTLRPGALPAETRAMLTASAETQRQRSPIARDIESAQAAGHDTLGGAWMNIVRQVAPANIVEEMARTRPLGVIVFALLLGLALAAGGATTAPVVRVFEGLLAAMLLLARWLSWLAPVGIFFLAAFTLGRVGIEELKGPLARYLGLTAAGLLAYGLIVLPIVLLIFARRNPIAFLWRMRVALLTACGTASSLATLPVALEASVARVGGGGGCSRRAASVVLPLGAALSKSGTALYVALATVFLFQLFDITLAFNELLIVVITATLAAIGAAGVPSAGLVTMVIVITAVNTSLGGRAELPIAAMGVIIGVDRILDMVRTTINVWSDLVAARIITQIAPDVNA